MLSACAARSGSCSGSSSSRAAAVSSWAARSLHLCRARARRTNSCAVAGRSASGTSSGERGAGVASWPRSSVSRWELVDGTRGVGVHERGEPLTLSVGAGGGPRLAGHAHLRPDG